MASEVSEGVTIAEKVSTNPSQDRIYQSLGIVDVTIRNEPSKGSPKEFVPENLKAYNFTTENIAAYIEQLGLAGKRVAAITGSGDFPISALMYGASSVDAFDIMPTACFYGELKVAGLKELTYDQFLEFFATTESKIFGSQSFSPQTYAKLRGLISDTARGFFDQLITPTGRSPILVPSGFLIAKIGSMEAIRNLAPYLKDADAYNSAKEVLRNKKIRFYPQPAASFLHGKKGQYDVVYLSNIRAYSGNEKKVPAIVAKDILPVGGQLIEVSPGVPSLSQSSEEWCQDLMRQSAKAYGMEGKVFLVPTGYTSKDSGREGANAVEVYTKRPSLIDRIRNRL